VEKKRTIFTNFKHKHPNRGVLRVSTAPLLSLDETLERMSGDRELLANLFQLFLSDAPKKIERIETLANENDLYGVERSAHSLKGAAATVGAARLCELAAETEKAAKAGTGEELSRLRRDLAAVCDQTLAAMREFCSEN
jgi:HPt (histidine-containing phosphotransfer) domain-containing protein